MAKDSLARGAQSANFGHSGKKDDPIEFHGTVATEEAPLSELESKWQQESDNSAKHLEFVSKCQPLNDRVLIRRIVEEDKSLIVQPDQFKQPLPKGEVVAVGSHMIVGQLAVEIPLKVGDKIFFGEYGAESFKLDGEELLLISAYDARLKVPE